MASKIAFIASLTLLITLTSAVLSEDAQRGMSFDKHIPRYASSNSTLDLIHAASCSVYILADTTSAKCALSDSDCVTDLARSYLDDFIKGSSLNPLNLGVVENTVEGFRFEFDNFTVNTVQDIVLEKLSFDTNFNVAIVEFQTSVALCFTSFTTNGVIFMSTLDATGSGCINSDDIRFYLAIPYSITNDIMNLLSWDYGFTIRNITYDFSFDDSSLNIVNTLLNKVTQVLGRLHGPTYYGKISEVVVNALNVTAANTKVSDYVTY